MNPSDGSTTHRRQPNCYDSNLAQTCRSATVTVRSKTTPSRRRAGAPTPARYAPEWLHQVLPASRPAAYRATRVRTRVTAGCDSKGLALLQDASLAQRSQEPLCRGVALLDRLDARGLLPTFFDALGSSAAILSRSITTMPSASPMTKSPGFTLTPPTLTAWPIRPGTFSWVRSGCCLRRRRGSPWPRAPACRERRRR
jgi:hypothetical protein